MVTMVFLHLAQEMGMPVREEMVEGLLFFHALHLMGMGNSLPPVEQMVGMPVRMEPEVEEPEGWFVYALMVDLVRVPAQLIPAELRVVIRMQTWETDVMVRVAVAVVVPYTPTLL